MESDVNRLIQRMRCGEKAAVGELIEEFYQRVYSFLRRLTPNDADAADLTQKTFANVWQALPTYAGRSSVSSWIHSIAYHVFVDWVRRKRRLESRSDDWWAERVSEQPAPDEIACSNDLRTSIYASVDRLTPELRDSVHLHYYQELTLEETALVMNVATSPVKYRLRQAITELEKQLAAARRSPASQTH